MKNSFLIAIVLCFALCGIGRAQKFNANDYIKAAESGNAKAQYYLAVGYFSGNAGVEKDYPKGIYWLKKAADQKLPEAQNLMGLVYSTDELGTLDYQQAVYWFKQAAQQDDKESMYYLGRYYFLGRGVPVDYEQAVYWFKKAVEGGYTKAKNELGECFMKGLGVPKDEKMGVYWYTECAKEGGSVSQTNLAFCYVRGTGVTRDYQQAIFWFNKAIAQNEVYAVLGMASLYASGKGVKMSKDKALEYIAKAEHLIDSLKVKYPRHEILDMEGEVYLHLNDFKKAQTIWEELQNNYSKEIKDFMNDSNEQFVHAMSSFNPELDMEIPETKNTAPNTFVFIIANQDYTRVEPVPFAVNDGLVFGEYCKKTLGIPSENIYMQTNASLSDMKNMINDMKQQNNKETGAYQYILYYAGHGLPADNQKDAFLIPIDGYGADDTGLSVNELYHELGLLKAKSVVVFLDACFSGAGREGNMLISSRGIALKVNQSAPQGNMVVFSATKGDETAFPYKEMRHGLFTYYLLKKLKETLGDLTLGDLADYVISRVKRTSIVENGKLQTPTVTPSRDLVNGWKNMKLNN